MRCAVACLAWSVAILALSARTATPGQAAATLAISARARAIQPGEVVRLDVSCTCERSDQPAAARVFGREIPLVPILVPVQDGAAWSGLIGIDVDTPVGAYPIRIEVTHRDTSRLTGTYTLDVVTKRFPTRQLRVAPAYVDPPPADLDRILSEARRLDALFKTTTVRERVGPFQAPVGITARNTFGARSIFNGQARSPHAGVDFGSPTGTPVVAPAAAIVRLATDLFFTGQTVILDHGLGLYSVLAHLSVVAVADGDRVARGQVVGHVGATGRVTGPHLHWGVRLNGARVDPLSLVEILAPEP